MSTIQNPLIQNPLIQNPQDAQQRFETLVHRCRGRVYGFAYRLTGNAAEAEDVVQDALVSAWQHFDHCDVDRSFEGWLFRIVTNRVIDLRRRRKRVPMYSLETTFSDGNEGASIAETYASPHSDPEEIVVAPILEETLQNALASLPTSYRTAILLCDVEQYSYQDIATMMHCPLGTVRSRINRARSLVRGRMGARPV